MTANEIRESEGLNPVRPLRKVIDETLKRKGREIVERAFNDPPWENGTSVARKNGKTETQAALQRYRLAAEAMKQHRLIVEEPIQEDVFVLRHPGRLSNEARDSLIETFRGLLPGKKVVILQEGMTLERVPGGYLSPVEVRATE